MATGTGHWHGGALHANVWLSQHARVIKLNLIISILFLKPHLNHPGQHRVTQASRLIIRFQNGADSLVDTN